jgi:hypothetical protein
MGIIILSTLGAGGSIDQDVNSGASPTFDGANITGIPLDNTTVTEVAAGATYDSGQEFARTFGHAGIISGGILSDAGSANLDVSAGFGFIRTTDSGFGVLVATDWAASTGNAIPTDTIRYVGVEYNAGVPQVVISATNNFDHHSTFRLGTVVNESDTLHVVNNPQKARDAGADMMERIYETEPWQRADRLGGLVLGETGTRNITITAGELYDALNEFIITAKDTSVSDTFDSYSSGGQESTGDTQWPNTEYDNAGTLTTMTASKYANLWFYVEADDATVMVYGTAEYATAAGAQTEGAPATIPNRLQTHGKLIGRVIFQKSAGTATIIESVFTTTFAGAGAADHGNLAGLADDDHTQYSLLSSQAGAPSSTPSRVGEINVGTTADVAYIAGGTGSSADWRNATERIIQVRLLAAATDHAVDTTVGGDFRIPYAFTVTGVGAYCDTAGTGSVTTIDINESGTTILSTKITIDATEKTSTTAATAAVVSDTAIASDAIITFDIDGIASGTAGKGLTVWIKGLI